MGAMDSWDGNVPFLLASQGRVYRKRERFRCFGRNDAAGHALKRRLLHKNFFKIKREKQERIAFLLFSLDFYGVVEYNKYRKRAIR